MLARRTGECLGVWDVLHKLPKLLHRGGGVVNVQCHFTLLYVGLDVIAQFTSIGKHVRGKKIIILLRKHITVFIRPFHLSW